MKKLRRADNTIDLLKVMAVDAERKSVEEYSEAAIKAFGDDWQQRLTENVDVESRIKGLRAEAVFMAVVAAMGQVVLIKEEDNGAVYYSGEDLLVPDFRVVLLDGTQWLVEAKVHSVSFAKRMKLSDRYVRKLVGYSERVKSELLFAIYWEDIGHWTLNRLSAFSEGVADQAQWSISFPRALATSEMASFGDYTVATRAPLRFRVLIDREMSEHVPQGVEGEFKLTLAGVQLLSVDTVLTGVSARLGWQLLWYGTWSEVEQDMHYENGRLVWIDHIYGPSAPTDVNSDAATTIATLSQLISNAYLRGARRTIHTTASDYVLRPGAMSAFIPDDWFQQEHELPIVVWRMQPNYDFKDRS